MSLILGVDAGIQNIGLVILNTDNLKIEFSECVDGSNYSEFYHYFLQFIRNWLPIHVSFEKPYFTPMTIGKNTRTLEVIGIQKLVCEQLSISYNVYSPATIKKVVTGNGRAKKPEVIKSIEKLFQGVDFKNNHIADAAGVAYTRHLDTNYK